MNADLVAHARGMIEEHGVRFVNMQFTDISGHVKTITIPVHAFDDAVEHGVWFDGSSIEGFVRIAESDMYLVPDLNTFAVIPWERGGHAVTARVICDVHTPDGEPFAGDPRGVLKRVLRELADMGYRYNTGPEPEFFLFRRDAEGHPVLEPHDQAGYFDVSTDLGTDVRRQMVDALQAFGIVVEAAHHEVAVGQHEIDFRYDDALRTADNVITLRVAVKAVAQRNGLYASFMPKPIAGINGSGMHVHQSLANLSDGKNAFVDAASGGLSGLAHQFIAGQLAHARGFAAVVAPLVNSYKRLVPGFEAPVYVSWARNNRSALIRVPRVSPGRPQSTRVELRCPDPSANPYLAFAAMLAAGIDGIRRGLTPPAAAEEDLYHLDAEALRARNLATLPGSLGEALAELEADAVVAGALGTHVFERFIEGRRQEWDESRLHVSSWEIGRYFETF
ncbi:type I glutamate--ammonia ligase [bacterium]|nr:type I glutamate--ammonia ligase [Chloroflexi bacterium CFX6]RIL09488.1 MAG: type I glutamate--ammonia ligase [bacterium]